MRSRGLSTLLGLLLICVSCASGGGKRLPWMEDGARRGTIHVIADGDGSFYEYREASGRLFRRERHLRNGDLDPSSAIAQHGYDEAGHETSLSFTDLRGDPILGPSEFATRRTERRRDGDAWLVDHRHYDPGGAPMVLPGGFHREEVEIGDDGFMRRRRFYDDRDQPAAANLEFGGGTFEIRYKRLKGTTPIVYETFFNLAGEPTLKRRLSGSTTSERVVHRHYERYDY